MHFLYCILPIIGCIIIYVIFKKFELNYQILLKENYILSALIDDKEQQITDLQKRLSIAIDYIQNPDEDNKKEI